MFKQRDPHPSQVESHEQDSSKVPIKSKRGSINRDIRVAKGPPVHTPNPSRPKQDPDGSSSTSIMTGDMERTCLRN
ncbi:hypothetical protein TNCV_511341 [Trichonephila clavipes]|nr:hypothetical protein TNCV_511341 [Trichonephila clavipes]